MSGGRPTLLPPFIGPRPFETSDRGLFFGRQREAYEISSLLLANKLVLLYAESGAGKTSLFNAGVRPIVEDDLDVLPIARFQSRPGQADSTGTNVYTQAVLSGWTDGAVPDHSPRATLAEFLADQPRRRAEAIDMPMPRLLVFDQFEELFTTHPDRWPQRREFLQQLAEASELDSELRILIIMREDFLARLLNFADTVFGGLKDRYFLEPLPRPAAEEAISRPVIRAGRSFEQGAIEDLIHRLMTTRVDLGEERIFEVEGEFVEPILLQVVCQRLWYLLPAEIRTITRSHVNQFADVGSALADFYSDAVRQAARESDISEREIRSWVGQELFTRPGGTRSTVHVETNSAEGLPIEAVRVLEGKILRGEFRAGSRWLEITHDSLLAPIEQSNAEFFRLNRHVDPEAAMAADQLAVVVRRQSDGEFASRTLSDPALRFAAIGLSWAMAPASFGAPWDALVELALGPAASGRARPREWASGPEVLAGFNERDLSGVLRRVPTGWLVVLGAPGSGKTTLLLSTVREMSRQRESSDPVPVYLPMASWNPRLDSLRDWLEKRLPIDYPQLGATVSRDRGRGPVSRISDLLDEQLIFPFLDGLDELPAAARQQAINRLDEAFAGRNRPLQLVLSSRRAEYGAAVEDGPRNPLRAAAAIELLPLEADKVASYLGRRGVDGRWSEVDAELERPGSPLATALETPLYASLAAEVYNPARHQDSRATPDPSELLRMSPELVRDRLLDRLIPAMYAQERDASGEQAAAENEDREAGRPLAERWLMFLADYLTNGRGEPTPDLEWWDLKGLAPGWLAPAFAGVICGVATAVAAATGTRAGAGIGVGFGTGLLIAVAIGLSAFQVCRRWDRGRLSGKAYSRRYERRRPGPGMAGGLIGAVVGGVAAGIAGKYHLGHEASLFGGLPGALGMAVGAGAATDFAGGLAGTLVGAFVGGYLGPVGTGLPAVLVNGLAVAVTVGVVIQSVGRHRPSRVRPVWDMAVGVPGGLIVGAVTGVAAWREIGVGYGILVGAAVTLLTALPIGLRHTDEDLHYVPSPAAALARDVRAFRFTALSAGLAAGATGFIAGSMTALYQVHAKASLPAVIGDGLALGLAAGLAVGLTFGFYQAASPEFRIVSWWLAIQGKAPWRLMGFLDGAYRRGILRQSGAAYQFRYLSLQLRLAARLNAESAARGELHASSPTEG